MNYPSWLRNRGLRPPEYDRLYDGMKSSSGLVRRGDIHALLQNSGLRPEHIGNILFLVTGHPESEKDLKEEDFFILLALIASYQSGLPIFDLRSLFKAGVGKVPFFNRSAPNTNLGMEHRRPAPSHSHLTQLEAEEEFTDFQSGFMGTSNSTETIHSTEGNSGGQSQATNGSTAARRREDRLLIGEVDKYSALRSLTEEATQKKGTEDFPSDFGDFQGFSPRWPEPLPSLLTTGSNTLSSSPPKITSAPLGIPMAVQTQKTVPLTEDFGDFVGFDPKSPSQESRPTTWMRKESEGPPLDISGFGMSRTRRDPLENLRKKSHESRYENILIEMGSSPTEESQVERLPPPLTQFWKHPLEPLPLKTTLITGPSNPPPVRNSQGEHGRGQASQSPETLSVSSLDLGSYAGFESLETSVETTPPMDNPRTSTQRGSFSVKHTPFREEKNVEVDGCIGEWERCVEGCLRLLQEGQKIFSSASSSKVIRQVLESEKGAGYLLGLGEIYKVGCRVLDSWTRTEMRLERLELLNEKMRAVSDSFAPFLIGTDFQDVLEKKAGGVRVDSGPVCGICLVSTQGSMADDDSAFSLDFQGRIYHLPCANFWINEISSSLPALSFS